MEQINETKQEVQAKTFGYISTALGLVAGLAWNDAIATAINALFPLAKDTVMVKFLYALIVTIAVVLLVQMMNRMVEKLGTK